MYVDIVISNILHLNKHFFFFLNLGVLYMILLSVSLWNELADPVFDSVGLASLRRGPKLSYRPKLLAPFLSFLDFHFSSFFLFVILSGRGLRIDSVSIAIFRPCIADIFF